MKESLSRLMALSIDGTINVNDFYNITIVLDKIKLQGDAKVEAIYKYKEQGFNFSLDESCSYMEATKDDVRIVFTF